MTSVETSTSEEIWCLSDHVSFAKASAGAVLLNTESGKYWQVNTTAAVVFEALQVPSTISQLLEKVASAFDGAADPAGDVRSLLHQAKEAGLVRHA